jgi:hypothetical protein
MELPLTRVALLLFGMSLWTPICVAQRAPKAYRIGIISGNGRLVDGSPTLEAFQQELRNRGYLDGAILIDQKNAEESMTGFLLYWRI